MGKKILEFRNNLTGDAVFNFLQLEVFLKYLNISYQDWLVIFKNRNYLTYKIVVKNKDEMVTDEWKGVVEKPAEV